ncbi:MAG: hypothetical protein L6R35_000488 [Caloplaca aegaea]|nr:MAG: hypothetical protein L6R35_000488 [Caloplaca aegaea]
MSSGDLLRKVEELSDLELALLLSLVANEHCLIHSEKESLETLGQELQLIASNTFTRAHALVECNAYTAVDHFTNSLLLESGDTPAVDDTGDGISIEGPFPSQSGVDRTKSGSPALRLPDIAILQNLNQADYDVQIQVLELIRTKRIYTKAAVFTAPKGFCVIIIQDTSGPSLNKHLIDHLFMSHRHDPEAGFVNLETASEWVEDDRSSSSSVVRKSEVPRSMHSVERTFTETDIKNLLRQSKNVTVTAEVECYLQNIVTFLRLHRAVGGGVTPRATHYFNTLIKCLAPLHGLEFVTPSLVDLAARKIYPHRVVLTVPDRERSLQYGSDLAGVRAYLDGMSAEAIVEDVLESVETPL